MSTSLNSRADTIFKLHLGGGARELYESYEITSTERLVHDCFLREVPDLPEEMVDLDDPEAVNNRHVKAEHFIYACRAGDLYIRRMHRSMQERQQLPAMVRADYVVGSPHDPTLGNLFLTHRLLATFHQYFGELKRDEEWVEGFERAWSALDGDARLPSAID